MNSVAFAYQEAQRKQLSIPGSLVRYSLGIENVEDLLADLEAALKTLYPPDPTPDPLKGSFNASYENLI